MYTYFMHSIVSDRSQHPAGQQREEPPAPAHSGRGSVQHCRSTAHQSAGGVRQFRLRRQQQPAAAPTAPSARRRPGTPQRARRRHRRLR